MDWQLVLVWGIVLAAAAYVAQVMWNTLRGKESKCGSCQSCPSGGKADTTELVDLDMSLGQKL
ncbi:MAG: FeoB-associated Cys-rich membrane protein [Planctomycetaceae bacterium]